MPISGHVIIVILEGILKTLQLFLVLPFFYCLIKMNLKDYTSFKDVFHGQKFKFRNLDNVNLKWLLRYMPEMK